mmetsp:Transcript_12556/g.29754  ORF Transcript_12556/g.29754 Transcript_12556/m.29754 type:complete len:401 (+) Transcript_12556:460-1662(+)
MQPELAIVEVNTWATLAERAILMLLQDGPQAIREEDGVRVSLDDPVVEKVMTIRDHLPPECREDLQIQRALEFTPNLTLLAAKDLPGFQPGRKDHGLVAVDLILIAGEDAGMVLVLHDNETCLIGVGHHQRQAQQAARLGRLVPARQRHREFLCICVGPHGVCGRGSAPTWQTRDHTILGNHPGRLIRSQALQHAPLRAPREGAAFVLLRAGLLALESIVCMKLLKICTSSQLCVSHLLWAICQDLALPGATATRLPSYKAFLCHHHGSGPIEARQETGAARCPHEGVALQVFSTSLLTMCSSRDLRQLGKLPSIHVGLVQELRGTALHRLPLQELHTVSMLLQESLVLFLCIFGHLLLKADHHARFDLWLLVLARGNLQRPGEVGRTVRLEVRAAVVEV